MKITSSFPYLRNIEITKYFSYEPRFNRVFSEMVYLFTYLQETIH